MPFEFIDRMMKVRETEQIKCIEQDKMLQKITFGAYVTINVKVYKDKYSMYEKEYQFVVPQLPYHLNEK